MKQIQYQGHARAEGFDPIRAPRESIEQIAAHGRRVIRGMEAARDQDMQNRRAYAQALENKFNIERRNRDQNFALEQQNAALVNKWQNVNTDIKTSNYETESKRWQAIAGLSQSAFKMSQELIQQKEERDQMDEYNKAMMEGLPLDRQLEHAEGEWNMKIAGEAIEVRADMAQAQGVPADTVEMLRSLNPSRRYGRLKAYAAMAGDRWSSWLESQFVEDSQTQVVLPGPDGQPRTLTPSEAATTAEKAAVSQVLFEKYLKMNGLDQAKPELLGEMFQKMRKSNEQMLARSRQAEASAAQQARLDTVQDTFFDSQTRENALALFQTASRTIDPRTGAPGGFRAGRFALYDALKQVDANGNLLVNESEFNDIVGMVFPGQTQSIADQYSPEVAKVRRERQDVMVDNYNRNERAQDVQHDQWTDEAEAWLRDNPAATPEDIQGLIDTAIKTGNMNGAKRLAQFMQFTPEAQQDKYYTEEVFPDLYMTGQLTRDDVLKAPISQEAKMKWFDRAKDNEQSSIDKDTWKTMESMIKDGLRQKLQGPGGAVDTTIDPSYHAAVLDAQRRMRMDYMAGMRQGMDAGQAYQFATDRFRAELAKEQGQYSVNSSGYKVVTDSRGQQRRVAVPGKGFSNYGLDPEAYKKPTYGELRNRVFNNPKGAAGTLRSEVVINPAELTRYVQALESGRRVAPPEEAQWIADQSGGQLSAYDVAQLQLRAAGIRGPESKPVQELYKNVSPEYHRLLNYKPSPTRTDIALIGSGMPQIYTTPSQRLALDVIGKYESDSSGGYNAMNEGGTNNGRTVLGYSGPSINRIGRNLTQMTVGEVIELHKQGRIHAAGRYQFTANTLPGVARDAKISLDTKFDAATQDLLGLTLLRQRGIQPWVGPSDKATAAERAAVRKAQMEEIQFAPTPWRNSKNMNLEVVEYITGEVGHPSYREDHGGRNYHEHIAFATRQQRDAAIARLEANGIRVGSKDRPGDPGYHGVGLALDVPADQVPVGQEAELSRRVRRILGMN